jgi:hypothetical protein
MGIWAQTYVNKIRIILCNTTSNNVSVISWGSVLLVEETREQGESDRPAASHWQTLSHNDARVHLAWAGFALTTIVVINTDYIGSYKSNYHTITTSAASYVSSIRLVVSSIRLVVSSIRLVVSSIRLVVSSIRLVVSSIRWVVSSIRLIVSSIRWVVSSIRLIVSSHRTTLTTWPPVTTCCLVYYIFYGD